MSVSDLRRKFDEGFSRPPPPPAPATEEMLAIRAGDQSLALRIVQFRQLMRCPPVAPLPGRARGLLGIAAIRGNILATYSLAQLLGADATAAPGRWALVCTDEVALVFEAVEGSALVSAQQLYRSANDEELVRFGSTHRRVVDIAAILRSLQQSALPTGEEDR